VVGVGFKQKKAIFAATKHFNIMNKVSENPFKNRISRESLLIVVTALFVTLYLVSNVMAVKVVGLGRLFYFDAGTITFPMAYMLGDVLTEIWGYRTTRKVILLTLLCNILMVICTRIGVMLPSPDYLADTASAYNTMFDYVPRIVLGSLVGFLLGELSNAWCMERIKRATKGRRLWVRTIGSSMVGYLFDSLPFVLIAFAGVVSTHDLVMMCVLQYVLKLFIEVLFGTPLAYAAIGWMKRHVESPK
jgi:uncharacterized integral membrane protein (TIGR00697 family)